MSLKIKSVSRHEDKDATPDPIVYVWPTDETVLDNLLNRRDRPHEEWRPFVLEVLREHEIKFEDIVWDQLAGCDCPCSPGFRVKGTDDDMWSIHISLEPSDA